MKLNSLREYFRISMEEDTLDLGAGKMPQQLRCGIFPREFKNI